MVTSEEDVPHKGAFEHSELVDDAELVGIDTQGKPVYYDPHGNVAFDAIQRGDSYEEGEQRGEGPLESIVEEIEDAVGWDRLVHGEDTEG